MFSQELENLIQATLEDGVLEPYEVEALKKRAMAEGVDLTELEIYINSLLQKRQRELKQQDDEAKKLADEKQQAQKAQQIKEAKEREAANRKALGYKECPKCHQPVAPSALVCQCGYEFSNRKSVSSVQVLMDKIENISAAPSNAKSSLFDWDGSKAKNEEMIKRTNQVVDAITIYPVPNTKEDIIEFLSLSCSLAKTKAGLWGTIVGRISIFAVIGLVAATIALVVDPTFTFMALLLPLAGAILTCTMFDQETILYNKKAVAWRNKFEQVLLKGRSLRGDAEFSQQLDYFEKLLNKK